MWVSFSSKPINKYKSNSAKFLQFPNHSIQTAVTGKRVKQVAGFGLEIPVEKFFYGDSRVTTWLKKGLEKLDHTL